MTRSRIIPFVLVAGAVSIAALVLFLFPPERNPFYPRCIFHSLTGLQCPGCGGLRAAHHLLHGDVAGAFHFNPLLVTLAPLFAIWCATYIVHQLTGRKSWYPFTRPVWAWALLVITIVFGVARNVLS